MNFKNPEYKKRNNSIIAIILLIALIPFVILLKSCNHHESNENVSVKEKMTEETTTINLNKQNDAELVTTTTQVTTTAPSSTTQIETTSEPICTFLSVEPIVEKSTSIETIEIKEIKDKITEKKEEKYYEYTSEVAGLYRFELFDVPNNIYFDLYLYNEDGEELKRKTSISNGGGISYYLKEKTKYVISVAQRANVGSYNLKIGKAKPIVDVTDYSDVSDKIQFTDQEIFYEYSSKFDGMYRFEFSEVPNNIYFDIYLYNEDGEELKSNTSISNGNGISYYLNKSTKYYIMIKQRVSGGSYKLEIGAAKPVVNTLDYNKISDKIQFTDQRNYYEFNSKSNKECSFILSDVPNNVYFDMYLYNEDMEELDEKTNISNGYGVMYNLKENTKYFVKVQQRIGKGVYTLNINN